MKKIVFLLFIIIVIGCLISKKNEVLIPKEAIRIRIIAASNTIEDQKLKADIKNDISEMLFKKIYNVNNYEVANNVINNSLNDVDNIVSKYTNNYEISYSNNYFPKKEYKGIIYDEGNYPSLQIKLGNGKGENFWCVLFPPLCLIDEDRLNDVEYRFLIKDLLNKTK